MTLADIAIVAEKMLADFGADAPMLMEARASDHALTGDTEGAEFWSQVAKAVRASKREWGQ